LLLGIAGITAGAGAGSAHLAKAGLDGAAAVAAVVLVTGLFLFVWGAIALVRALPGWCGCCPWRSTRPTARPARWDRPPPASYGLAYHDVAFCTSDAVRLSAWYLPSRNGAMTSVGPGGDLGLYCRSGDRGGLDPGRRWL
jgi:hypothetical protein